MSAASTAPLPPKRAACDRCRTQKLRCLRVDGHPNDSCARCVRSQVPCITSSFKRPGRPTRKSIEENAARQQAASSSSAAATLERAPGSNRSSVSLAAITPAPIAPSKTTTASSSCASSIIATPPLPHHNHDLHQAMHSDVIPMADIDTWLDLDALDSQYDMAAVYWPSTAGGEACANAFPAVRNDSAFSLSEPSLSGLTPDDSLAPHMMSMSVDQTMREPSLGLPSESDGADILSQYSQEPSAPPMPDHGLHLSALQSELCRLSFATGTVPWDVREAMKMSCSHSGPHECAAGQHHPSTDFNPLNSVVHKCAEFAAIMRSLRMLAVHEGRITSDTDTHITAGQLGLSVTNLLTALSCHILIISIYDAIFAHFIECAMVNGSDGDVAMSSGPNIMLGGVPVPSWPNMLGHLLCSVAESRLRPIEMMLGLPEAFCVSSAASMAPKDLQSGLFGGPSGQSLFTLLNQMEGEGSHPESGGLGVIALLREKFRRVREC